MTNTIINGAEPSALITVHAAYLAPADDLLVATPAQTERSCIGRWFVENKRLVCLSLGLLVLLGAIIGGAVGGYCASNGACWNRQSTSTTSTGVAAPSSAPDLSTSVSPTSAPIAAVESAARTATTNFINQRTLSGRTISVDGPYPEDAALRWLIDSDPLALSVTNGSTDQFRLLQRYALLTLWFQQSDDNTMNWINTTDWLVSTNECMWFGIECNTTRNAVTEIVMSNELRVGNHLVGTIPADLAVLSSLHKIDFFDNDFSGTLPGSIGVWTNMQFFSVFGNRLTGTLPEAIGQWTNVEVFDVYGNALSGTIPNSILNWSRIERASFGSNDFTGTVPSEICSVRNTTLHYLGSDCRTVDCACCTDCV